MIVRGQKKTEEGGHQTPLPSARLGLRMHFFILILTLKQIERSIDLFSL